MLLQTNDYSVGGAEEETVYMAVSGDSDFVSAYEFEVAAFARLSVLKELYRKQLGYDLVAVAVG